MSKKYFRIVCGVMAALCVMFFFALIIGSRGYQKDAPSYAGGVKTISEFTAVIDGNAQEVTLPHSFSGLKERTPVTLSANIAPKESDCLYIKSVYSPMKVYANDTLIYECGQDGGYPGFMQDPATTVIVIPLKEIPENTKLNIEYLSLKSRDTLTLHPILIGSAAAILRALLSSMGFSFVFSLIQIFCGVLLVLISLCVIPFERRATAFMWLGLFSFLVGLWAFGECNLSGLFIRNSTLLYLIDFAGLFSFPIPLIFFGLNIVKFHNERPLKILVLVDITAVATAFFLQLLGVVAFSSSMYFFHFLVLGSLVFFAGCILHEGIHYKNRSAKRFFVPMVVLALSALLAIVNYKVRFTGVLAMPFQLGIMIFIVMTGFVGGMYIRDAIRTRSDKQRLEFEVELMEHSIEQQKKNQQFLLDSQDSLRAQRHDLRHQLAVFQSMAEASDNARLTEYLQTLGAQIPKEPDVIYCENMVVNSIVSYYADIAKKSGIELSIKLTVPAHTEQITDSNLCVIFGNLMENGIEACKRMGEGHRFIRLKSRVQYELLTIIMDNSFDGEVNEKGGRLISRKRNAFGTGTASVRAVAEKHGGGAQFEADGRVFKASVYVHY